MLSESLLRCLTQAMLLYSLIPTTVQAFSLKRQATTCNGHAEVRRFCIPSTDHPKFPFSTGQKLCSRSYGNISFVGAHDSFAVGTNNRKFLRFTNRLRVNLNP